MKEFDVPNYLFNFKYVYKAKGTMTETDGGLIKYFIPHASASTPASCQAINEMWQGRASSVQLSCTPDGVEIICSTEREMRDALCVLDFRYLDEFLEMERKMEEEDRGRAYGE